MPSTRVAAPLLLALWLAVALYGYLLVRILRALAGV